MRLCSDISAFPLPLPAANYCVKNKPDQGQNVNETVCCSTLGGSFHWRSHKAMLQQGVPSTWAPSPPSLPSSTLQSCPLDHLQSIRCWSHLTECSAAGSLCRSWMEFTCQAAMFCHLCHWHEPLLFVPTVPLSVWWVNAISEQPSFQWALSKGAAAKSDSKHEQEQDTLCGCCRQPAAC